MKTIILLIYLVFTLNVNAQLNPIQDSILSDSVFTRRHPESWKKPTLGARIGLSVNKVFYPEIGISIQRLIYSDEFLYFAPTFYASYGYSGKYTKHINNLHTFNLGFDYIKDGGILGLNISYQSDGANTDFLISPKIGFGFSFMNFYYSYCFSTENYPFSNFGKHQFGLVINTNQFHHNKK
jgi:hypothetical protein